jgi:hypothetical protein
MDGEGAGPRARTEPIADDVSGEHERTPRRPLVLGPLAGGQQAAVSDAHGRQIEDGAQLERKPRPARVVTAGRVHEQGVRELRQGPDGALEQASPAEGEQARLIGGSRRAGDDRRHLAERGCR